MWISNSPRRPEEAMSETFWKSVRDSEPIFFKPLLTHICSKEGERKDVGNIFGVDVILPKKPIDFDAVFVMDPTGSFS